MESEKDLYGLSYQSPLIKTNQILFYYKNKTAGNLLFPAVKYNNQIKLLTCFSFQSQFVGNNCYEFAVGRLAFIVMNGISE